MSSSIRSISAGAYLSRNKCFILAQPRPGGIGGNSRDIAGWGQGENLLQFHTLFSSVNPAKVILAKKVVEVYILKACIPSARLRLVHPEVAPLLLGVWNRGRLYWQNYTGFLLFGLFCPLNNEGSTHNYYYYYYFHSYYQYNQE